MKHQIAIEHSNKKHLKVSNFDNKMRIDLKRTTMDSLSKISLNSKEAQLTFERTDNELFTLIRYNCLAPHLEHDTIIEEAYLWLREMELKFYGEKIFNYQSQD